MQLPLLELHHVIHIGSLNPALKKPESLEGNCLSVSLCPNAWAAIARLGEHCHILLKPVISPASFLDAHAFLRKSVNRQFIEKFGVDAGYVTRESRWKVRYFNEEAEDHCFFYCISREAADQEAEQLASAKISETRCLIQTEKLSARADRLHSPIENPFDMLLIAFLLDHDPQTETGPIDGLWWRESYDPANLSAPRGAILPHRLTDWSVGPKQLIHDFDDDNILEAMPRSTLVEVNVHEAA